MLVKAIEKEKKRTKEEGREEEKVETVKRMLLGGFDVSVVSQITLLSEDEILQLKENLQN